MDSLDQTHICNASETNPDTLKTLENNKRARRNSINNRQFLLAIGESNIDEVKILLKKIDINFKDQDGCTPLNWAVKTGDIKIIEILLDNGVHLDAKNNDHETSIDIAKRMNRSDIVNIIEKSLYGKDNKKSEIRDSSVMSELSNISENQEVWINPVHGYIYQLKVLMLFLHRGLSCKYSFRLGTEIKKAKKFDDLVFEYLHQNKKVYRLLQAKHKFDESKKITVDKLLTDPRGDYSLVKYFYSFQSCKKDNFFKDGIIKDVIICTNINFDFDDLKKSGIEFKKVEERDDILDIISNEKKSIRYKFTNTMVRKLKPKLKPTVSVGEIEDFLNHLIFAVNQPNEEELGQILKKEIGREIGFIDTENAYNKILVSMMDLSLGKNNSMFLSHDEGRKFFNNLKREIPIWFNIQEPVMSFTGRSEYLERIHDILTKKLYACISGMGGVGKTELARKYIADYANEYDNQVIWINAESYRSAADSFRRLASDKLNISLNNLDGKEKHISSIVTHVYQFFSKGKSLFIFDNAEKYKCKNEIDSGIERFLPCLPNSCIKPNVVITSRNQKWPRTIETIVLNAFKADEAKELVEKMLAIENSEQKESIVELCETLQYFPLALQQAVAYIKMQREQLSCTESDFEIRNYLDIYSCMALKLLDFSEDSDTNFDSNYDKSVFATWNITFDALKQKEYGTDALEILNFTSYFLPENIPVELLLTFSIDSERLNSAIGLLQQYSLVTVQHKFLDVHRLVQQVTRIKLQKQNDEINVLLKALKLLERKNLNFKNIDHVISICTFAREHSQLLFNEYMRISSYITAELHDYGRYEEAICIGNEALSLSKASPQINLYLAGLQNNMALCYIKKGEYIKALEYLQKMRCNKVYNFQTNIREPLEVEYLEFLITQSHMAVALNKLGRNKEALPCCFGVLNACKSIFTENHPIVLDTKSTLSNILSEEGEHEKALSIDKEIYQVQKRMLGDRHPRTLTARKNLAVNLGKLGKIDESLKILKQVCNDQEIIWPKNHPSILSTKCAIADLLTMQQKHSPALEIYEELLDVHNEKFGENNPEVIDIILRMGVLLHLQGKYEESLKVYKNGLDKQKNALGPLHPLTLGTETLIANIYVDQEKYTDALEIFKDVLDKQISVLGSCHTDTLETRRYIVKILVEQEKYDAALEYSNDLVTDVEKVFGKNHPSTLNDKSNLGMVYFHKEDFNKALATLTQVLEVQERHYGKDHVDCQTTKDNIALVLKYQIMPAGGKGNYLRSPPKVDDEYLSTVKKVFDINIKDEEGLSMLHKAVQGDDEGLVEFFLNEGAEVFVVSNKGNTPLHIAALKGREKSTKLMLQKVQSGRLKDFVDAKTTSSASTALHVAAKMGHFGIVKCLLKSHATFCVKNKDDKTPLDLSTDPKIKKFLKVLHELFESVKQSDAVDFVRRLKKLPPDEFLAVMNTRNDQGSTLSQVAILSNQKHIATQILKMMQKS